MQNLFKKFFAFFLLLGLLLGTATLTWAAGCQSDISAVDRKIRDQYGGDFSKWQTWFACPVCIGGDLRKDAIVTKEQVKEISTRRNIASIHLKNRYEQLCVAELKNAKRMLRIN